MKNKQIGYTVASMCLGRWHSSYCWCWPTSCLTREQGWASGASPDVFLIGSWCRSPRKVIVSYRHLLNLIIIRIRWDLTGLDDFWWSVVSVPLLILQGNCLHAVAALRMVAVSCFCAKFAQILVCPTFLRYLCKFVVLCAFYWYEYAWWGVNSAFK